MITDRATATESRIRTGAGHTPRIEVDLPAALTAIHTAGLQTVPDMRGGTVVDLDHPAMAPLLPYLPATGTWILVPDAAHVRTAHRRTRPADTIVLDGRARPAASASRSGADLVILSIDHVDPSNDEPDRSAALIDLSGLPQWRISPRLLSAPGGVEGFHLDLSTAADHAAADLALSTLACALHRWKIADRGERPFLVLRGVRTLAARQAISTLLRTCRDGGLPEPILRVDVTPTVLDVAVRTVVSVIGVGTLDGRTVLETDGLPPAAAPVHVLRRQGAAGAPADVVLRHSGRLLPARLHGGPARPGDELAVRGWSATRHPLVVRGFPTGVATTIRATPDATV